MRHFLTLILITSLLALSACGFHLRGQLPLPENVNVLYVDGVESEFNTNLVDSLTTAGAKLVDQADAAKAVVEIKDEVAEREALTVNTDGRASSYKLHYTIKYAVVDSKEEVLREGSIVETRQYSFDSGQAVVQEQEEAELLVEMRKELAIKMVRLIGAL